MPRLPLAFAFVLLAACNTLTLGAADRGSVKSRALVEACPLGVPWTTVSVTDSESGALIDFRSSSPQHVDELRRRVRDQASAYGPEHHRGAGHDGEHHGTRDHGLRLWELGPLETEVIDTPAGARLLVVPLDPVRRFELRERIAARVAHLQSQDCPS